jgi:hypothetical protein
LGYRFTGFFIDRNDTELVAGIQSRWPLLETQPIYNPFRGFGFCFPDYNRCRTDEEAEAILEQSYAAENDLPAFSAERPDVTFLWVEADCSGGACFYAGYACRSGVVLLRESESKDALARLVRMFGVELGANGFFKPFTRGFFPLGTA